MSRATGGAFTHRVEVDPWVVPFVQLMIRLGACTAARPRSLQAVVDFVSTAGTRELP